MNDKPHNHEDPETVPEFLCRLCHPELNATPEAKRQAERAELKAREKKLKRESKERECANAERSAATAVAKCYREGTVSYKVTQSLVKKAARLKAELDRLNRV